ncbi:Hypothetical protein A7982_00909 [Minicystis rosea]|nr:Hypothetical protein A7982_00909 [Minicystis rosea]
MAEPSSKSPPEVAVQRLAALARSAGTVERTDRAFARGRARLIEEVERAKTPPTRRPLWLVAVVPLAIVIGVLLLRPAARLEYQIDHVAGAPSYVRAGTSGATARFNEGTTIGFAPGARGRITAVTAHGARVSVEEGNAHFRVSHLPGAEWVAEAGPFTVTVTGTEFDLSWQNERLDLTMQSGSVVVRGPLVSGGVALRDGQHLVADAGRGQLTIADPRSAEEPIAPAPPNDGASVSPSPSASEARATPEHAPAASGAASARAPAPLAADHDAGTTPSYREMVARGDFAAVVADAEARGVDTILAAGSLRDLAALADAARYAGRSELSRRALMAERSRFAGSPEARSAAFLLGRMVEASSPSAAISWYDQYLAESPGGSLAAEALGRKMIAVRNASGREAARPIAEEYVKRHPQGSFAAAAAEILDGR